MTSLLAEQGLWYGRLCTASSSAIILYDHLITFGDEVRLIWRSRWSAGKVLFLISRYYNIFTVIFNSSILYSSTISSRLFVSLFVSSDALIDGIPSRCFAWLRWQATSGIFVYGLTEIILMLRLYAMYSSSRRILALLVVGFTTVLIAEIVIVALSTQAQIGPVNADPSRHLSMSSCILTDTWPLSYLYWLPFLAFEFLLFALALAKGVQSVREHELELGADGFGLGLCCKAPGRGRAAKALEILIRDSILYFVLIFAIFLANTLAWIIKDGRIGEIPVALAVALSTVMAQRLLLNIRENFERRRACMDANVSTAAASETFALSTMAFDGQCVVSEAGPKHGEDRALAGLNNRARQAAMTSSTLSGLTAVSPVSPVSTVEVGERNRIKSRDSDLHEYDPRNCEPEIESHSHCEAPHPEARSGSHTVNNGISSTSSFGTGLSSSAYS